MCFSISCVFSYNCIKLIVFWVDILVYFHRIFVFFFFFLGYLLCKDWFNLSWKSLIQQSIFNEGSGPTSHKFRIAAWCMQLEVASRTNVNGCLKVAVVAVMFILFFFSPNPICRVSSIILLVILLSPCRLNFLPCILCL